MAERGALRRLGTFVTSGPVRQMLCLEAAFALLHARVMLLLVPFQKLAGRWGTLAPVGDPRLATTPLSPDLQQIARDIGWAVTAIATVMPFKAMCMQQAVAAHAMLARRGVSGVMHYGAGHDEKGVLIAHAWLEAGGVKVTGYPVAPNIVEIGAFVRYHAD